MSSPAYSPDAGVHEQAKVVADLLGRHPELVGDLVDRDAVVPLQIRDQRQHAGDLLPGPGHDSPNAARSRSDDLLAYLRWRHDDDVGAVGRDLRGEVPRRAVRHLDLVVLVVDGRGRVRHPAERLATPGPDAEHGQAVGLGGEQRGGHLRHVGALRDLVRARFASGLDLALHPRQPEDARRLAIQVVTAEIPPVVPRDDPPRLHVAARGLVPRTLVDERDRDALGRGLPHHVERRLVSGELGLGHAQHVGIDLDACGLQLDQGGGGLPRQPGVLPHLRRQSEHGSLLAREGEVGELGLVAPDAVADLVLEVLVVAAHLHRDAELAELLLVTLELALERLLGGVAVVGDRLPDLFLGEVLATDEEREDEVHQPLGLALGHGRRMSGCVEQVDGEHQRVARLDRSALLGRVAVGGVGRADEDDPAADLVAREKVLPARDDLIE